MLEDAIAVGGRGLRGFAHWQIGFVYNLMGKPQDAQKEFDWVPEPDNAGAGGGAARGDRLRRDAQTLGFSAMGRWWLGLSGGGVARCVQA